MLASDCAAKIPLAEQLGATLGPIERARGLPSALYVVEGALALERERVFAPNWTCIGFAKDVPEQGDARLALSLYTQALKRAHMTNDTDAAAAASFGRAASLARLRRYEEALAAIELTGAEPRPRYKQAFHLLKARIYLEQGEADAAAQSLDRADALTTSTTPSSTRIMARLTRGQLAAMAGDIAAARAALTEPAGGMPTSLRAQHKRLLGMITALEKDFAGAAKAHQAEAEAARLGANWPAAAEALARAAQAHASHGDHAAAAAAYFRAGRSARLQADARLPADRWLNNAIASAKQAGDDRVVESARQMLADAP